MRVAIVNDVPLITEVLRRIVTSDPGHRIVWTALDGSEAVRRCEKDQPDVILMDLLMPVMNGADATREIMQRFPCPILVVTSTVSGNYTLVCQALGHGAYDAVNTPTLGTKTPREAGAELFAKLALVDKINQRLSSGSGVWLKSHATNTGSNPAPSPLGNATASRSPGNLSPLTPPNSAQSIADRVAPLVVLGASTGGPPALEKILSALPANFPGAVLVVQHIDRDFTPALVNFLSERCQLRVVAAATGDRPLPGTVLVAATNDHLVLKSDRTLTYTRDPLDCPYRPSVDAMFDSLAQNWRHPDVAVLLTGIGRDGAEGMLKLRQQGWLTIAQDEASCIVYGMPRAAAQLGAASRILPLSEIAGHIQNHVRRL
jgi:two-component system response regulator WspF